MVPLVFAVLLVFPVSLSPATGLRRAGALFRCLIGRTGLTGSARLAAAAHAQQRRCDGDVVETWVNTLLVRRRPARSASHRMPVSMPWNYPFPLRLAAFSVAFP